MATTETAAEPPPLVPSFGTPADVYRRIQMFPATNLVFEWLVWSSLGDHRPPKGFNPEYMRTKEFRKLSGRVRHASKEFKRAVPDLTREEAPKFIAAWKELMSYLATYVPVAAHIQWMLNAISVNPMTSPADFVAAIPKEYIPQFTSAGEPKKFADDDSLDSLFSHALVVMLYMLLLRAVSLAGDQVASFDSNANEKISKAIGNLCGVLERGKCLAAKHQEHFFAVTTPPVNFAEVYAQYWHELVFRIGERFVLKLWGVIRPIETVCLFSIVPRKAVTPYEINAKWSDLAKAIESMPGIDESQVIGAQLETERRLVEAAMRLEEANKKCPPILDPICLSVVEAAKYLGVTDRTVRDWRKNGKLVVREDENGQWYFSKSDLQIMRSARGQG